MKTDRERADQLPERGGDQGARVRVVIVEDENWMRENLRSQINRVRSLRCVGCYRTAEEALSGIAADKPEVILMDINLPGMSGVECVRCLKAICPDVRVLMLTVYEESEKIFDSLLAGANGYLLKRASIAEIMAAIKDVLEGGAPMTSHIARKVVQYFNRKGETNTEIEKLGPREREVLTLLAKGAAYKQIAHELGLSIETIRMNVKHIYSKLHVHSRAEAAAKCKL